MSLSKTNIEYWKKRIIKHTVKRPNGETYTTPDYMVRMTLDGKRHYFNLETPNRGKAANKAREIYEFYRDKNNSAEDTINKYKKGAQQQDAQSATVGEFLSEVEKLGLHKPKTFKTYATKLRNLVCGVMKINSDKSKCDYVGHGYMKWKTKVESVKLSSLTPARILQWRAAYLETANTDPLSYQSATRTVNSILRNAKSLFSPKILDNLSLSVPFNPFKGVPIGSLTTKKYKSKIDFPKLAENAQKDLFHEEIPQIDPSNLQKSRLLRNEVISKNQQFKILLLGLGAGLRRSEIDCLLWQNVDFQKNSIYVETTEYSSVKSDEGERVVDLDSEIMELLKYFRDNESGKFVIQSKVKPRPNATYYHYRCNQHFKKLVKWLKGQGIARRTALHELRREFGSKLCSEFGIYVASKSLGHSDVRITAASYLEKKKRFTVKIFPDKKKDKKNEKQLSE